ncbi:testis-specific Y-encoded protein 3-like [Myotis daubentonii]|uniref:testis-specific Y-encoded protein 3-like n=1 Tax=Myotis daubentonii TaxID=98922 RepID=UPI002872B63A|nr:testis-specific Y-encoded protein 3-like [Myotis daubentonii]
MNPQISAFITDEDEDLLNYLINVEVREVRHPWGCCTIRLYFCSNPYFHDYVIVKEYPITLTRYKVSRATPIQWSQHCEREAYNHRLQDSSPTYYWYSDHSVAGFGRMTEIISKNLWLNTLKNYERMMAPTERTGRTPRVHNQLQ